MILSNVKNKWSILGLLIALSVVIPFFIILFLLVTTERESVVLFENTHPFLAIPIMAYYGFIFLFGLYWLVKQVIVVLDSKNEKAKTELMHLKSQVSPHFFFNMLNNLYGLVETDSKKAQALILKLSDMMRYSIYEGEKEMVQLEDEIAYLKNYIELHQMRYHKQIAITFNSKVEGKKEVMPLLFIILLENAFKHGVETLRKDAYVHVKIKADGDKIRFEIENNFDISAQNDDTGIGLKNLRRRLELVYPNKHTLALSTAGDVYKATLILQQL